MIMKNLHISMAFIFVLLLITASCSDKDDSAPRVIPTMNLTVSEIADNTALITSEQQTGTTFGAKVIDFYPVADIGFDYNIEVKLVKFVEENGEPVSLPYTRKITEGLRPGVNYISAIIAYNAEGVPCVPLSRPGKLQERKEHGVTAVLPVIWKRMNGKNGVTQKNEWYEK